MFSDKSITERVLGLGTYVGAIGASLTCLGAGIKYHSPVAVLSGVTGLGICGAAARGVVKNYLLD